MQQQDMQERAYALFQYLKELAQLTQIKVLNVNKQLGKVQLSQLDDPACVKFYSRDTKEGADEDNTNKLFTFHKPEFTVCPKPDALLIPWLLIGWEDYSKQAAHLEFILPPQEELPETASEESAEKASEELDEKATIEPQPEYFTDNPERVKHYEAWLQKRDAWVEREKHTKRLRDTFTDLFTMYTVYRQQPDTVEIVIGNGLLTDKANREIRHPLFLKRVALQLDAVTNTIEMVDTDENPQMYMPMFSVMEDVQVDDIRPSEERAVQQKIHPLDHHACRDLLRSVTHLLHASSRYLDEQEQSARNDERIVVCWEPYIILRKKPDGTSKTMEKILADVNNGANIPMSIAGVLGECGAPTGTIETDTVEAENAEIATNWAASCDQPLEDEQILLPKPANREQMQIVRRIEKSPAVLVQGPPGTGKTHTIANLMGHFLAMGKTVLVTSHTSKALAVLKDKIPEDLKPLCVAVFGDNSADMEESVNNIIEKTAQCSYESRYSDVERLKAQRHQTLLALQEAREKVRAIRHKEFEPIVFEGESWSPAKAAAYVAQHEVLLSLIPGEIAKGASFPLSAEALSWLYQSNEQITAQEEAELATNLPDTERLMSAEQLANGVDLQQRLARLLQSINAGGKMNLVWKANRYAVVDLLTDQVYATQGDETAGNALKDALAVYDNQIPGWAVFAIADGAEDGLSRKRWEQLISLIEETFSKAQSVLEGQLTKPIQVLAGSYETLNRPFNELLSDAEKHGQVKKGIFMSKEKKAALDAVTVNGNRPTTADDIRRILAYFELLLLRERLGLLWDNLLAAHGARRFADCGDEPERTCHQRLPSIRFWVDWYRQGRKTLCETAISAGLGDAIVQPISSDAVMMDEKAAGMLQYIKTQFLPAVHLLYLVNGLSAFTRSKESTQELLMNGAGASVCTSLQDALAVESAEQYALALNRLSELQKKAEIQRTRADLLNRISAFAPGWADCIRNRIGCHGEAVAPDSMTEAWKVHQLSIMVDEITNTPLSEAEKQVTALTNQFRRDTEKLASAQAWLHLQSRIDRNPQLRQILNGWKQTIVKIGKGTGKNAASLRAEAQKLMIDCKAAVPAWIMPVASVMNSVDPAETKYDVIIIDEASQSDVTATAILYMGKKIIVVGDDEQVSPQAVGIDDAKVQNLMNMSIKGKIPNAHLWDAKTSLYDIAAQVYQPLMLREHFRCVPDIIGYSNMLSYHGRIKPLREAGSSPFKTAMISYRVNGRRKGKVNEEEANAIIALMQACMEQPEYKDKTFGVISMLGDDQVKLIMRKLADAIPLAQHEKHKVLCGNASNFQGDERDVIFLSMVDSNAGDGPLAMASGEGQGSSGKAMKQRYNVAVSRARDQLWVVHSLDYTSDLKPGDLRRGLLEYVADPHAAAIKSGEIDEASDSPFEAEVAKALVAHGYHIAQQWQAGAYRMDMVAIFGQKKIAIECDGERWHSGDDQIRQDVERQSVLERLGWRFIRIRGSEYYRNSSKTIERVINDLIAAGIQPEATAATKDDPQEDMLLQKIKQRAGQFLNGNSLEEAVPASCAAASAEAEETIEQTTLLQTENQTAELENRRSVSIEQAGMAQSSKTEDKIDVSDKRESEQIVMQFLEEDLLTALSQKGFQYLDNRKISGLIWVYYEESKVEQFKAIRDKFGFHAKLEKRGAKATNNKPAWCITGQK